jgi:hypothetical protein
MKSMSGGNFSPIPKAMLDMLAKMTLEEETTSAVNNTPPKEQKEGEKNYNDNNNKGQTASPTDLPTKTNTKIHSQQITEMAGLLSKASQEQ